MTRVYSCRGLMVLALLAVAGNASAQEGPYPLVEEVRALIALGEEGPFTVDVPTAVYYELRNEMAAETAIVNPFAWEPVDYRAVEELDGVPIRHLSTLAPCLMLLRRHGVVQEFVHVEERHVN